MRLKNNSDKDFSFEGTQIPAGGSSLELSPELAGRLLALYWHNPLEPIEEAPLISEIPKAIPILKEEEPEENDGLEEE